MAGSLIEVTLVIAVVAVIASTTVPPALDRLENARVARAMADTELFGIAVHNFMTDTGIVPAYQSGQATGAADDVFFVLETDGEDPLDETESWPTDAAERDRIENHLVKNQPDETGPAYRRQGEISFQPFKGWNGPYLSNTPSSDPWGTRYLINVQFLTSQGVDLVRDTLEIPTGGRVAVIVLSPGPNRAIETRFDQLNDGFESGGDDIIFRIQ